MTDIPARELPRIRKALERIADGIERYADADPLTVLHEAMRDADSDSGPSGSDHPLMPNVEPQGPYANNGVTYLFKHPVAGWEVVLRRDANAPSGYVATIEEA